jgi:hypothetical protein
MIENALFMRIREKHVLNGVQMEYGIVIASRISGEKPKEHAPDIVIESYNSFLISERNTGR